MKFAGDAVFTEWRCNYNDNDNYNGNDNDSGNDFDNYKRISDNNSNKKNTEHYQETIHQCTLTAATCGANIVAKCSEYPVLNSDGVQISTLNVHCGLAYGKMSGVHLGNNYSRREFLVLGDSIEKVTAACDAAIHGELMASPEAYEILRRGESISQKDHLQIIRRGKIDGNTNNNYDEFERWTKPIIIASRNERFFQTGRGKSTKQQRSRQKLILPQKKEFTVPFDKMDLMSLKHLQKLVSLYVHPVVASDEITNVKAYKDVGADAIQERHRSEAELRSVYTLFIKPLLQLRLSNDVKNNRKIFEDMNEILSVVNSVLDALKGHLRQFIVDDKGKIYSKTLYYYDFRTVAFTHLSTTS